jgi:hypothetical protein
MAIVGPFWNKVVTNFIEESLHFHAMNYFSMVPGYMKLKSEKGEVRNTEKQGLLRH